MRMAVSMFSYNGEVNFGVGGDYDTAPDIDVLAAGIERGIQELLEASGAAQPASEGPRGAKQMAGRR